MRLSDENLRGRTVIAADGQAIGEIAALFLDSDAWRVESLQIKLRNEVADQLGARRGMFHAGTLDMPIWHGSGSATPLSCRSPPTSCGTSFACERHLGRTLTTVLNRGAYGL
jgi:sporulation protein YlmC with PRC-barrel domain